MTGLRLTPVVLIPGFTGSRFVTSFEGSQDYPLWLNHAAFTNCDGRNDGSSQSGGTIDPSQWWLDEMSLLEDGTTPRCPESRPMLGLEAISVLDPVPGYADQTRYFFNLIEALQRSGYDERNLAAAPYDWRMPPAGLQQRSGYFDQLQATIERLANATDRCTPCALIGHSLGNRVIQYFLQWVLARGGQEWIDRYVRRYIAVSSLWLGVPKSIREALTGASGLGLTKINGLKPVYQSYGALPWMLPVTKKQYRFLNTEHFAFVGGDQEPWSIDRALERGAPSTLGFMEQFFLHDHDFSGHGGVLGSLAVQRPPVRTLNVLHATGQNTEVGAFYQLSNDGLTLDRSATSADEQFEVVGGVRFETSTRTRQCIDGTLNSGDTFLPYGSLRYFTVWQEAHPEADITGRAFPGRTHYDILQSQSFLTEVMTLLDS